MRPFYSITTENGVAFMDIIEINSNDSTIVNFFVPPEDRWKGIGSELMRMVTTDADRDGVVLRLVAKSLGEMSQERLKRFYQKFGFQRKRRTKIMIRQNKK